MSMALANILKNGKTWKFKNIQLGIIKKRIWPLFFFVFL